jgi:hypothetical protein
MKNLRLAGARPILEQNPLEQWFSTWGNAYLRGFTNTSDGICKIKNKNFINSGQPWPDLGDPDAKTFDLAVSFISLLM